MVKCKENAKYFTHVFTHAFTFHPRFHPSVKILQDFRRFPIFAAENKISVYEKGNKEERGST